MTATVDPRLGLDRTTRWLLVAVAVIGLAHHTDHVLRVDHSGWPFLPEVTPFTFSLAAYPIIAFAYFGPARLYWGRWALLAAGMAATLYAHIGIETPQMQYAMWAYDRSLEPRLWDVRNLCGIRSGAAGAAAVVIGMALNVLLVVTTVTMAANGVRREMAR